MPGIKQFYGGDHQRLDELFHRFQVLKETHVQEASRLVGGEDELNRGFRRSDEALLRRRLLPGMTIQTKRVYEPAVAEDGARLLVDRLWPR